MDSEEKCTCIKIIGHLEAVKWQLVPRTYYQSPNDLALADWTKDPFIWLHFVESCDGTLPENDILMSTDSRYWSIHDVQRYFVGDLHCEKVLFTYQYPNLRMPTPLGNHFWKTNAAHKLPDNLYMKELNRSLEITLKKMENEKAQMDKIMFSDQLIKLDKLDFFKRKSFFKSLHNILSFQDRLQLVSFENMCCERLEGVRLIQQLACYNSETLQYLFLWRFVQTNQNPLLINYSYIKDLVSDKRSFVYSKRVNTECLTTCCVHSFGVGTGQYIPRPHTKQCFLRSLGQLTNLRMLALEYSHIADYTGGALLSLLNILKKPHFRLQLMCRDDHVPCRADPSLGVGGYGIPDFAWRKVAIACPDLYLLMAFYRIRYYDNVRRFLTSGVPLRDIHVQMGIDLKISQRQDSDVSCFVRHIAYQYANAIVCLSIHQWRFATFPIRRVFELMPGLVRFSYCGCVEDEIDLYRTMNLIACGVCTKLKQLWINIQDTKSKREYWKQVVKTLNSEYQDIAKLYDFHFSFTTYKN